MSVIRWLVVHKVCGRFEFARHFESLLARPPPFYMHMQTGRLPLNIPLLLLKLHSTRVIIIILNLYNIICKYAVNYKGA